MREILFKGKRMDNGEWIEGDLQQDKDLEKVYISGYDYYYDSEGLQREAYCYEVDSETVGQYIGINDRKGNRIFDNDIVKLPFCENDICIFVLEQCNYHLEGSQGEYVIGTWVYEENTSENINIPSYEVVGNQIDNLELLKGIERDK